MKLASGCIHPNFKTMGRCHQKSITVALQKNKCPQFFKTRKQKLFRLWTYQINHNTRMHSSRMRTSRPLTVCWSLLPGGVSALVGDVCSGGGLAWRGLAQGGYIPVCTEADPLPPVDRQTPVKILPWPNFVAAGKNEDKLKAILLFPTWDYFMFYKPEFGNRKPEMWTIFSLQGQAFPRFTMSSRDQKKLSILHY